MTVGRRRIPWSDDQESEPLRNGGCSEHDAVRNRGENDGQVLRYKAGKKQNTHQSADESQSWKRSATADAWKGALSAASDEGDFKFLRRRIQTRPKRQRMKTHAQWSERKGQSTPGNAPQRWRVGSNICPQRRRGQRFNSRLNKASRDMQDNDAFH